MTKRFPRDFTKPTAPGSVVLVHTREVTCSLHQTDPGRFTPPAVEVPMEDGPPKEARDRESHPSTSKAISHGICPICKRLYIQLPMDVLQEVGKPTAEHPKGPGRIAHAVSREPPQEKPKDHPKEPGDKDR